MIRQQEKDWQDIVFLCSCLFFFLFYIFVFSTFNQFPSEYYGGDQYVHFGSALKIYDTLNPFLSSHYYNELQHYPWLIPFSIAMFSRLFFQDPFQVAIYFPLFILIATMIVTYIFGKRYFESKTWALILTLSWAVEIVPSFHPSDIARQLMIPLLCLFIMLLYPVNTTSNISLSKRRILIAGIIYGLSGLEHVVTFFVASVLLFFIVILKLIQKTENHRKFWDEYGKKYLAVALIGWIIASLFWMPLIIKYHGKTLNNWQEYTTQTIIPGADIVSAMFMESMKYHEGIISKIAFVIMLLGICIAIAKKENRIFIPLLISAAGLIGIIHPYMTYSLFGMTLGYYRFPIVFVFAKQLFLIFGLYQIWNSSLFYIKKERISLKAGFSTGGRSSVDKEKIVRVIAGIFVLFWLSSSFYFLVQEYTVSERYEYAILVDEKIEGYKALREFIKEEHLIAENEVTLTVHPDVGFFFNAMTGKNVMLSRITHATPFVDHNQRAADMAIILYGNDSQKADELMKQYNLAYFFSEIGSFGFKRLCLKNWNETVYGIKTDKTVHAYWCLQTDPKYKEYLAQYGIETATASVRLASGDQDVPLTKVLAIEPQELKLNLQEVYSYQQEATNKTIMKLYKIIGTRAVGSFE